MAKYPKARIFYLEYTCCYLTNDKLSQFKFRLSWDDHVDKWISTIQVCYMNLTILWQDA